MNKEKFFGLIFVVLLSSLLILPFSLSTSTRISEIVYVNGTTYLKTTYEDSTTKFREVVYVNGTAYVNITLERNTNRLERLEDYVEDLGGYVKDIGKYIKTKEGEWSSDAKGATMGDVVDALQEVAEKYRSGETDDLSPIEKALLNAISQISYLETKNLLNKNVNPTLDSFHKQIQDNIYSLEAISNTLEITSPEEFCEMKREILKKYNLGKVECGLSSKICYNGEKYPYEDGRDYCIYDDKNATCYLNGGCGRVKAIKALKSETNSSGIFNLKFENDGIYKVPLSFEAEINDKEIKKKLGFVKPGEVREEAILWNTSGLKPGEYSAVIRVFAGPKEIIDLVPFRLLPYGEIQRKGEITYLNLIPKSNKTAEIKANYTNLGYPTSVRMEGEIWVDGNLSDSFKTGKKFLKNRGTATFSAPYKFDRPGDYEIRVQIGKKKKTLSFTLKEQGLVGYLIKSKGFRGILLLTALLFLGILFLKNNSLRVSNFNLRNFLSENKGIFSESFSKWNENEKSRKGKRTYLSQDGNQWVMFYNDYHEFNDVNLENGSIQIKNKRIYPNKNFSKYLEKGKGLKFHVGVSPNKNIPEGKWYFQGLNILTEGKLKGNRGNEYLFGKFNGNKGIVAAWEGNQIGVIKNPCVRELSGGNGKKRFYLSGKEVPVIQFERNGKDLDLEVEVKPVNKSLGKFRLKAKQGEKDLGEIQGEVDLNKIGGIIGINSIAEGRFKDFQVSLLN